MAALSLNLIFVAQPPFDYSPRSSVHPELIEGSGRTELKFLQSAFFGRQKSLIELIRKLMLNNHPSTKT